jgi:dihydrofolate reductase
VVSGKTDAGTAQEGALLKEKKKMRKLIVFNLMTLDGYFAGQDGDISWHNVDEEFNKYAIEKVKAGNTLLFGRVTYELMAGYWPTPEAIKNDPIVAERMNNLPKIVFSRTLDQVHWNNTRLVKGDMLSEIRKMKQESGNDMTILGSGSIVSQLAPQGLIDEFQVMLNPVVLGKGKTMFQGIQDKLALRLTKTRVFYNGNVLLHYEPAI